MPRTWVPPTMGERPTTGALVAPQRLAHPGDAEDGADGDDRVGRRQEHQVGVGDRVDARPAPGVALVETDDDHGLGGHLGAQPHPVLLEVHDPAAARRLGVGDRHVRLDPVVGHRQQPDAPGGQRRHSASVTSESG